MVPPTNFRKTFIFYKNLKTLFLYNIMKLTNDHLIRLEEIKKQQLIAKEVERLEIEVVLEHLNNVIKREKKKK